MGPDFEKQLRCDYTVLVIFVGFSEKIRPACTPKSTPDQFLSDQPLQYALEQMGSHLEACFWKCCPKFPFARIPIFMARCLFSTLRLRVLFSQEIVPHFVYLLNPFLSVFPCKKAKSCFSKSFCRLARRWPRFPFARIPIFNALCLFFVLVPYSHLLEFPFARERTV